MPVLVWLVDPGFRAWSVEGVIVFGDEGVFEFFGEPETLETVEQGWRLPRLGGRSGDGGGRSSLPPGLVGIGRLAGLVAVVIAAVVGLVTGLGACQGAGDNYVGYLAEVGTVAHASSRVGAELTRDLKSSTLKTSELGRRLQGLAAEEQLAFDMAEQIRPPGPLREVHQQLLSALELRAAGLAGLGQALASVVPQKTANALVVDALVAQARLLTASDVVWGELYLTPVVQQLRAHRVTGHVVPTSRFVSDPQLVGALSFTRLLQHSPSLTSGSTAQLLKSGASGAAVAAWQRELNRWLRTQPGQPLLPIDGTYGSLTEAATKTLQQAAGITADGIVGPTTRQALTHQLGTKK